MKILSTDFAGVCGCSLNVVTQTKVGLSRRPGRRTPFVVFRQAEKPFGHFFPGTPSHQGHRTIPWTMMLCKYLKDRRLASVLKTIILAFSL